MLKLRFIGLCIILLSTKPSVSVIFDNDYEFDDQWIAALGADEYVEYEGASTDNSEYTDLYDDTDSDQDQWKDFIDDSELASFFRQFADAYQQDTGESVDDDEFQVYDDFDGAQTDKDTFNALSNDYFDELDEFYYNNYRLHSNYDDFADMDFSEVLQNNADDDNAAVDALNEDDISMEQLFDLLDAEQFHALKQLKDEFKEFNNKGKKFIDQHKAKLQRSLSTLKNTGKEDVNKGKELVAEGRNKWNSLKPKLMNKLNVWKQRFLHLKHRVIQKMKAWRSKMRASMAGKRVRVHSKLGSFVRKHGNKAFGKLATPKVVKAILQSYMLYLQTAAKRKGWQKLDGELVRLLSMDFDYPLQNVRFAESVNTLHGEPVTFGYEVFFPRKMDFKNNEADLHALVKQLAMVQYYQSAGGIWQFLEKYLFKLDQQAARQIYSAIIKKRAFNLNSLPLDRTAEQKAGNILPRVWLQYKSV